MDPDQAERTNFNRLRTEHEHAPTAPALHLAIPDLADGCYLRLAEAVCRAAHANGLGIRLTVTRLDRARESEAAAVCEVSEGVGLVLVTSGTIPSHIAARCRVVGIGTIPQGGNVPIIETSRVAAMDAVFDHLVSMGHTSIHFEYTGLSYAADRTLQAFNTIAAKYDVLGAATFGDLLAGQHLDATVEAIANGGTTAVVVDDDEVAGQLVTLLRTRDIRVPLDVSVAGMACTPNHMRGIGLTTVDHRVEAIAAAAIDTLLRNRAPDGIDVSPRLIVGATTGFAARKDTARRSACC